VSSSGSGLCGDVERDIIGVAGEEETMLTYDITKRVQVEDEQKRTKHRALGDALIQRSSGGGAAVDAD